ncbi:MAG: hypothetical protein K8L99_26085 [Anaerolineae bacterium]|nr:hypothetical protein [Anaerolineae bacterium]
MITAKTRTGQILILFFLVVLSAAACRPQTPILIYVTPTPQATVPEQANLTEATEAVALATNTTVPTIVPPTTESPTEAPTQVATQRPVPTETVTTPEGTARVVGAVVGPDYTPPPTNTPNPTRRARRQTQTPTPTTEAGEPTIAPTSPVDPSGLPNLDPSSIGLQVHSLLDETGWDGVVGDIERLEIGWVKIQIDWSLLQPNNADEITEDFRRQELYLESLDQRGLKLLISVAKAPAWARSNTTEAGPPDDPQVLANFISLMLREFGEIVDAIEIWNEPNLAREWRGTLPFSGAGYMQLFGPAYDAIRAYSPDIVIVTGGPAPTSNSDSSVDDRNYLQQMYAAGLGNYPDVAIGVHPYGWGNPPDAHCCDMGSERGWDDDPHFFFLDTLDEYREIMVANGHENAQLWPTEFGWATWDGLPGEAPEAWMTYNDRWSQGEYILRAFQIGQETDYIGPMFLWNLNFALLPSLIENRDERAAYGLIVPLQPRERPAYWMLYDAVHPDIMLDRYN